MFRNIGSFSCFTSMCVPQISWATALWGGHYCGTCAPVAHMHASAGHAGMAPAVVQPMRLTCLACRRGATDPRPIRRPGRASRQPFPNTTSLRP